MSPENSVGVIPSPLANYQPDDWSWKVHVYYTYIPPYKESCSKTPPRTGLALPPLQCIVKMSR